MRIINQNTIKQLIDMEEVIAITEKVYQDKSLGKTCVWPTIFHDFVQGEADMDIKSGYLPELNIYGHKTVSFFNDNTKKGLPTLIGLINLFSAKTGMPIGALEGAYVTGLRTGAAGAIAAKYLANPNPETVLILGTGNQAFFQVAAILTVFPCIKQIYVANTRNIIKAKQFVNSIKDRLSELNVNCEHVNFKVADELALAVKISQIIITVTPSHTPIIKKEWVSKGTHFSCIGADALGKQEIESSLFDGAKIIVDDFEHCIKSGEIEIPIKEKNISPEDIMAQIGDVILGKCQVRTTKDDITIFDATGMALLDLAVGKVILDKAEKLGLGQEVSILS